MRWSVENAKHGGASSRLPAGSPPFAPLVGVDGLAEPDELTGAFQEGLAEGGGISAVTELHFLGGGEELL
jgi:hypothetical protein